MLNAQSGGRGFPQLVASRYPVPADVVLAGCFSEMHAESLSPQGIRTVGVCAKIAPDSKNQGHLHGNPDQTHPHDPV